MKEDSNGQPVYTPKQIAGWIARYQTSGLGLKRFGQQHGIPANRLHYWVYQKRRSLPMHSLPAIPVFQEVKLPPCLPGTDRWAAEVSLARGLVIRFSAGTSPSWMGSVVEALQRPC
jgi:hypothetical protein